MILRKSKVFKAICFSLIFSFLSSNLSQAASLNLPDRSQFISLSESYSFPVLKGLKFDPANPLRMEFIVDTADKKEASREEISLLIKYFLAGLTTPEKDIWVNLSPYEQDRVIPEALSQTDLGKDLLSQDYLLKQLTASLTYPESDTGKDYWEKTYAEVLKIAKTTNLPVNTFNKIWIMPDEAEVYEKANMGLITKATLTVMLEEDYLALKNKTEDIKREKKNLDNGLIEQINKASSEVMKQTVLPKITSEINQGKNFATLRQIYHSLILGMWFKQKFQESIYKHYINQQKIQGIDLEDKQAKERIYQQYVQAFKDGLYNYIRTDTEPQTHKKLKRRYYSGGFIATKLNGSSPLEINTTGLSADSSLISGQAKKVTIENNNPAKDSAVSTGNPLVGNSYYGYSNKMSVTDIKPEQLSGRRVFVRVDLNVVEGGKIKDETRLREIVNDIEYLVKAGALVILASHSGRRKDFYGDKEEPDGAIDENYSLKPVAQRLTEILREKSVIGQAKEVKFTQGSVGDKVKGLLAELGSGDILLLENLRFHSGEESGAEQYAQQLYDTIAPEAYVNIAFGALHRGEQASFNPLMKLIKERGGPVVIGQLVANEINMFNNTCFKNPTHPIYAIFGGSKVADKVRVLRRFIQEGIADKIRITGAMAFPFLIARGYKNLEYSFSMVEKKPEERGKTISYATEILKLAKEKNIEILLPERFRMVKGIKSTKEITAVTLVYEYDLSNIPLQGSYWALDEIFGLEKIRKELEGVKNIILNGTAGLYEVEQFVQGTNSLVSEILQSPAFKLILGGDGAAAVNKGIKKSPVPIDRDKLYISTGGGVALQLLAGEELSALRLINEKSHIAPSALSPKQERAISMIRQALAIAEGDDYFIKPLTVEESTEIEDGDSVILFNFRSDRMQAPFRLLTGDPEFRHFSIKNNHLVVAPFAVYDNNYFKKHGFEGIVEEKPVEETLGEVMAKSNKTQVRIAESEKFEHVTRYFDGLKQLKLPGMDTVQIPSNKIDKHWKMPGMKAIEIAQEAKGWILGEDGRTKKDFIVVNFANGDILGHFDKFDAIVEGVLAVDEAVGIIRDAVKQAGGITVITADHGSAEQKAKLDKDGQPILRDGKPIWVKAHSFDNRVPFIIEGIGDVRLRDGGSLKNIAPTILELMGIKKPQVMIAESLLKEYTGKSVNGPVVLVIRDGWGISKFNNPEAFKYNAIYQAELRAKSEGKKWNDEELMKQTAHTELLAHGEHIGHPEYQMGDSENGHSNIGAGRDIETPFGRLNRMLEGGEFADNKLIRAAIDNAKKGHKLHLFGMLSAGGVHSHIKHVLKLLEIIAKEKDWIKNVVLHPVFDGRDVESLDEPGWKSLEEVLLKANELGLDVKVGTISGRYYAMDRDAINLDKKGQASAEVWIERLQQWYDEITKTSSPIQSVTPVELLRGARARQVFDSRGFPTVEAEVTLPDGRNIRVIVPSGASTGKKEALELRDGGNAFEGKGVTKAVNNLQNIIIPAVIKELEKGTFTIFDQEAIDRFVNKLDGDPENLKRNLGANATLAFSILVARIASYFKEYKDVEFYRYINSLFGKKTPRIPLGLMNVLNGGKHALDGPDIQEFMIAAVGARSMVEQMEIATKVFHVLGDLLKNDEKALRKKYGDEAYEKYNLSHVLNRPIKGSLGTAYGDEGGFVPQLADNREPFLAITAAIRLAGYNQDGRIEVALGMDGALSEWDKGQTADGKYRIYHFKKPLVLADGGILGKRLESKKWEITSLDLIRFYKDLIQDTEHVDYLFSIEDGLGENDWKGGEGGAEGWETLTRELGPAFAAQLPFYAPLSALLKENYGIVLKNGLQIVADDLSCTNPKITADAIKFKSANALLDKINQIGTLTEAAEAANLALDNSWNIMVSHRSGETEDVTIVPMAVGLGGGFIKTGAPNRTDRTAKYNELLRIEENLEKAFDEGMVPPDSISVPGGINLEDTADKIRIKSDGAASSPLPKIETQGLPSVPIDFPHWQGLSFKIVKIEDIKDLKDIFQISS